MSSLNFSDKKNLEKILDMSSGYVLDFSDRTFGDFIFDYTSLNIHDIKYQNYGTSKAKKLRSFWEKESDIIIKNLLIGFSDYIEDAQEKKLLYRIANRLVNKEIDNIDLVHGKTKIFNLLKSEILLHTKNDKYIESLDRIHTLFHSYLLELCAEYEISYQEKELVNSLLGKIKNYLILNQNIIKGSFAESSMSKIINILENYNSVRNNHSLSHPNELLSYDDAKFAVNMISICLSYIDSIVKNIT